MEGIQKSTTVRIITCTGSKSTPCLILNIVYNILNNIVYYIYINFQYLINIQSILSFICGVNIGVEYLCYITNTLNQLALRRLSEQRVYKPLPTHHTIYNPHKNPHSHTPLGPRQAAVSLQLIEPKVIKIWVPSCDLDRMLHKRTYNQYENGISIR